MTKIASGNSLSRNDDNGFEVIPGYRFKKARGYVVLSPTPRNRFTIFKVPESHNNDQEALTIERGGVFYGMSFYAGDGVRSTKDQYIGVNFVPNIGIPQGLPLDALVSIFDSNRTEISAGAGLPSGTHPSGRVGHRIFETPSKNGGASKTTQPDLMIIPAAAGGLAPADSNLCTRLLRSYYFERTAFTGGVTNYPPENNGTLEIQVLDGVAGGSTEFVPLGQGLKQSSDAADKDKGYMGVELYYYVRDWVVDNPADYPVNWEDVFKYVF